MVIYKISAEMSAAYLAEFLEDICQNLSQQEHTLVVYCWHDRSWLRSFMQINLVNISAESSALEIEKFVARSQAGKTSNLDC